MTTEKTKQAEGTHLLEDIAETIRSIDRTVEEIRDHIGDFLSDRDWYERSWRGNGYDLHPEDADDRA
jgi:uncharacterized protein YicC (UPF0701 family)